MDAEQITQIASIASSLTTNGVLLLWLYREIKRADRSAERLEKFHDREREERMSRAKDDVS